MSDYLARLARRSGLLGAPTRQKAPTAGPSGGPIEMDDVRLVPQSAPPRADAAPQPPTVNATGQVPETPPAREVRESAAAPPPPAERELPVATPAREPSQEGAEPDTRADASEPVDAILVERVDSRETPAAVAPQPLQPAAPSTPPTPEEKGDRSLPGREAQALDVVERILTQPLEPHAEPTRILSPQEEPAAEPRPQRASVADHADAVQFVQSAPLPAPVGDEPAVARRPENVEEAVSVRIGRIDVQVHTPAPALQAAPPPRQRPRPATPARPEVNLRRYYLGDL